MLRMKIYEEEERDFHPAADEEEEDEGRGRAKSKNKKKKCESQ